MFVSRPLTPTHGAALFKLVLQPLIESGSSIVLMTAVSWIVVPTIGAAKLITSVSVAASLSFVSWTAARSVQTAPPVAQALSRCCCRGRRRSCPP